MIRRSGDRLIFNMETLLPGEDGFIIETVPWLPKSIRKQDRETNQKIVFVFSTALCLPNCTKPLP